MEEDVSRVKDVLNRFGSSFKELESSIKGLLEALPDPGAPSTLSSAEQARLHVTVAYAVNSLFHMYLRTQGVDPRNHPVNDEIARVHETWEKLRGVEMASGEKGKGEKRNKKKGKKRGELKGLARAVRELDKALAGREVRDVTVAKRIILQAVGRQRGEAKGDATKGHEEGASEEGKETAAGDLGSGDGKREREDGVDESESEQLNGSTNTHEGEDKKPGSVDDEMEKRPKSKERRRKRKHDKKEEKSSKKRKKR